MTTTENTWHAYAARLADQLVESGDIQDPAWAEAIAATPRHVLVPTVYRQKPYDPAWEQLDGDLETIYSPITLITAIQDGQAISSSTRPDLMVRMLEILDVHDGHRVLEIGTGTGYNAALLSHRLGDNHVYSIDVDAWMVDLARTRLASIGRHPRLAAIDGAQGWPDYAPFDRIIATCSVQRVPWSWADQLSPGGAVLVDVKVGSGAGNLAMLYRYDDRLEGRFTRRYGAFMDMRHQPRTPSPRQPRESGSSERDTEAPPQPWNTHREMWLLAALGLPYELSRGFTLDPQARVPVASTLSAPDGSWCEVDLTTRRVREAGPTRLWKQVERAHEQWQAWGKPTWERFGLTVTAETQAVWLDDGSQGSVHRGVVGARRRGLVGHGRAGASAGWDR